MQQKLFLNFDIVLLEALGASRLNGIKRIGILAKKVSNVGLILSDVCSVSTFGNFVNFCVLGLCIVFVFGTVGAIISLFWVRTKKIHNFIYKVWSITCVGAGFGSWIINYYFSFNKFIRLVFAADAENHHPRSFMLV